jgi:predicted P-loop ATPase
MSAGNPKLVAALDYARRGWKVIPLHNLVEGGKCSCDAWRAEKGRPACPTPGKHPRFLKWAEVASADPSRVSAWWKAEPEANIGVLTGKESGIVLDTDPRNGGDWSRGELIQKHGDLGDCPTCVTGGRGLHEHFAWPDGLETTQAKIEIADGLEVLLNCNCVMPPSYAHATGDAYFWDVDPGEDLPQAPEWLVGLIRAKLQPESSVTRKPAEGGAPWPKTDVGPILQGCGWLQYCSERAASLTEPEWYAQLSIVGRCENGEHLAHELSSPHPGYTARETAAKLRQALRAAGPATCGKIRHSLGGERFCAACPSWSKIKSPIVLGLPRSKKAEPAAPPASEGTGGGEVVAGETFTLMQLVERVIAEDVIAGVFDLVPQIAEASEIDRGKALSRLRAHFDRKLSIRDLKQAIAGHRRAGARVVVESERGPWTSLLLKSGNGTPRANLANAITALRHAPEWAGVLWRDEFKEATWSRKKPPIDLSAGEWTNLHDIRTAAWLQHHDIDVSIEIAGRAVESVAYERRFHPVREYLNGLKWDGEPRIERWLERYCGAKPVEAKPTAAMSYLAAVASKWLVSAVARVMQPGCKADCALILEGPQGTKKSSALKALCGPPWFTDQLEQMNSKDSSMQTHGVWIIEISELDSMSKAEIGAVKAFMSRTTERYRPPYAGRLVDIPRQCIFAGTVNPGGAGYMRDETGGRRFWPVECGGEIDLDGLLRDRDQIWAEARVRYGAGFKWWLDQAETLATAEQEQAARYREDPWDDVIAFFIRDYDEVTIDQLMREALRIDLNRWTQADANRVASVLRFRGWRRVKKRDGKTRTTVYRPHTLEARLANAQQERLVEV